MNPHVMRWIKRVLVSLVVCAMAAVTAAAGVRDVGPAGDKIPVSAYFTDASPLVPGNEVKASGVTVGEIVAVELEDGKARVQMLVDRAVLPVHDDARAVITAKDLLGERFVDLQRGSSGAPAAAEPLVIPVERTSAVVDLEDVLNSLDDPASAGLAGLVGTAGQGVAGQGEKVADGITAFNPAMQRAAELSRMLDEQNAVLNSLVDSTEPVAAELAADGGRNLDRTVGSAERTLTAVAAERKAVADSLDRLPGTLTDARHALAQVGGVAEQATPALQSIRPVTDDLTQIDAELRRFADSADPALGSLPPVLDRAKQLIDEAGPLVHDLAPAGGDIRSVAFSAHNLSEKGASLRVENLMKFVKFWALSTAGYDGLSHYFRASIPVTPAALGRTAAGPVPGLPDSPIPNLPTPNVPRAPLPGTCDPNGGHPCEGETGPQGGPAAGPQSSPPADPQGGATGLDQQQEQNMVDQLLGGG